MFAFFALNMFSFSMKSYSIKLYLYSVSYKKTQLDLGFRKTGFPSPCSSSGISKLHRVTRVLVLVPTKLQT